MEIIFAALALGFLTSFHCIGMCGPIAVSLPLNNYNWQTRAISAIFYNLGRTTTYVLLGVLFGIIGVGFSLAGFQNWLSILIGIIMILSIVFPHINSLIYKRKSDSKFIKTLKNKMVKYFQQSNNKSLFVVGLLNGLLPCGMVYVAIASATALGSLLNSVLFMLFFGLATIPMLLAMSILGNITSIKLKKIINKTIPFIVVIIGIIFILRGLNLGIPYISPKSQNLNLKHQILNKETINDNKTNNCCH